MKGFILTRHQKERGSQTYLEYWLSTDDGPVKLTTERQSSVFFVPESDVSEISALLRANQINHHYKAVSLKTFSHQAVSAVYFPKASLSFRARELLMANSYSVFEHDIRLTERFLMERFIYGTAMSSGHISHNEIYPTISAAKLKPANYSPQFKVLSVDLECSEKGELYSIGLAADNYQQVVMIGEPQPGPDWILWVDNEKSLLLKFVQLVQQWDPDVFIGWNVINFDFRLLIERAKICGVSLNLGRERDPIQWRNSRNDVNQGFVSMSGRLVIDGIDALKTATYHFDSFSLEFVAQELLGKGKDTQDVKNRLQTITHDFHHNKVKLAQYNLQDCVLVNEIFTKTKLLDFLTLRSQLTGLELDRVGGSVAAFINLYLPRLHRAGYVSPNRPSDGGLASPGGYVMNSRPGLYQHVLVLDFKSLYPSIIRTFKIDPLGLIEGLLDTESAIPGFKGAFFSRNSHFLPDIITSLWQQRDEAKKQKDSARSQAIKILMNSFYGVLGSGGCPFYDTRLASSITMRGHEIMQTTAKWIEESGHVVIYGDTDSTFVWLQGERSNQDAEEVGRQLESDINAKWKKTIADDFNLPCELEIEFETHFEQFLMPTIRGSEQGSKKRYAGLKRTNQGTEFVFKGLETVRSDWTELAKQFQRKLYELVFAKQDVKDYLLDIINKTKNGEMDDLLIYRKRLRQSLDKYVKNVPPHVKAARTADERNAALGKPLQYQHKGWISYVITLSGPQPVEYVSSGLDYDHYIEKQIRPIAEGILPFIDISFESLTNSQMGLF